MKKYLFIFLLILPISGAFAQGAFQFEEEEYNFGDIKEGTLAEHVFSFKNTGNAPIVISEVKASCGCTTPEWSKEPVMPGETGSIKAVFNSKGRPGNVYKTITIKSNAAEQVKTLKLKGQVIKQEASEGSN
ncbi:DUF1573 domain-containing protein [Flexithrix dorotheae]|uniref:DUF1573 domain-containing protein n=1 Tax=Flexithrix dorotheae TaxID=70993 RepID=UPI00036C18A4|nr:DUF1573 domain-containing protein [Flexithrix dorotheae]